MSGTRPEFAEGFKAIDGRRAIWYDTLIPLFFRSMSRQVEICLIDSDCG